MEPIGDLWESAKDTARERLSSPLAIAFALAWLAWNYRFLIVVFGGADPVAKFRLLAELYPTTVDHLIYFVLLPFLSAAVALLLYPFPARFAFWLWRANQREMKKINARISGEEVVTQEEALGLRAKNEALRRAREKTLKDFSADRAQFEADVSRLSSENTKLQAELVGERQKAPRRFTDKELRQWLRSRPLRLMFDPRAGEEHGSKPISFLDNGVVGDGRNRNEHTYKIENDHLIFFNEAEQPHSIFAPDYEGRDMLLSLPVPGVAAPPGFRYLYPVPHAGRLG